MESYNSNNDKPKISLNRKKRMWNRYRNYIAGLAVLVVAVIIVAIVLKSCSNKNSDRQDDTKVTTSPVQQESTAPVIQESKEPAENVTGQTTAAASGRTLSVSGTPETVDYTSSSAYSKAVFIGDFVVSGISQFGIDTLEKTWRTIVNGIDETRAIQENARKQRIDDASVWILMPRISRP